MASIAGTVFAGYANRSTDGVPGIVEISVFGFMVRSVVAKGSLRCSPQEVENLPEVGGQEIVEFCSIVTGSLWRIQPGVFYLGGCRPYGLSSVQIFPV